MYSHVVELNVWHPHVLGHHSDFLDVVEGLAVCELQTRVCPPLAEEGCQLNIALLHVLLLRKKTQLSTCRAAVLLRWLQRDCGFPLSLSLCVVVCVCVCVVWCGGVCERGVVCVCVRVFLHTQIPILRKEIKETNDRKC